MKFRWLNQFFIAISCLAMLTACTDDDIDKAPNVNGCYINLAISVSNGNSHSTRAGEKPTGGENGDGREAGFERENTVTGITLILYKDANGINTASDPTLDLVRYFPVTERTADAQGTTYSDKTREVTYTTGNQALGKHSLDLGATYHAIVIANAPSVALDLTEGTSTLSDLRNKVVSTIYAGSPTMSAENCTNFAMSSEWDNTINFGSVTGTNLDGSAYTKGNDILYDVTAQPLMIERMAARIDFWAANSTGYDASTYSKPGYVYSVTGSTTDKFVVTGIVPFNLTNGHTDYGQEYLLKRIRTNISDAATTSYLADEITTNYVIDPKTIEKLTATNPTLINSLENVYFMIGSSTIETSNPYYRTILSMHGSTTGKFDYTEGSITAEDVVVCYPMENTLLPESKLYYHATGIAIVGYYYTNGSGPGDRLVYLGYLCHQGDAASYDIAPYSTPLSTDATMGSTTAMKYGIVRNNIYRVSINSIDKKGVLDLKIKVKKWDPFTHSFIYM